MAKTMSAKSQAWGPSTAASTVVSPVPRIGKVRRRQTFARGVYQNVLNF